MCLVWVFQWSLGWQTRGLTLLARVRNMRKVRAIQAERVHNRVSLSEPPGRMGRKHRGCGAWPGSPRGVLG